MCGMRSLVTIAVAIWFAATIPARALFVPGFEQLTPQQAEIQAKTPWPELLKERMLTPVGNLAASFDYRHGTQDFDSVTRFNGQDVPPPFISESELNSYVFRPELVLTNWLSVYGITALHDGSNRAGGNAISLDGWGAGAGVTGALGWLPVELGPDATLDPFFVLPDFNWTYNEFDGIENAVKTTNLTIRVGSGARFGKRYNVAFYGGPMYQDSTRNLDVVFAGTPLTIKAVPVSTWTGVVGGFLGVRFGEAPSTQKRPDVLVTLEGGIGNRTGVLLSLRYEYDLLSKLL